MHLLKSFFRSKTRLAVVMAAVVMLMIPGTVTADDQYMMPPLEEFTLEEITDEQLQRFGLVLGAIQQIELEANEMIEEVIEESPLTEDQLQDILMIYQTDPGSVDELVSEDEQEVFEQTIFDITEIHQVAEEEMIDAVEHHGFEVQEFNVIVNMIHEDPKLLDRLQEIIMMN